MTTSAEYKRLREIWRSMKKRCYNPKCKDYAHYGGRGIRVCDEWREDFDKFYDWALSRGYRNDLTLDRVCNSKGYNPGNCRWISRKAQCSNRTTNTHLTIDDRTRTLKQWSLESGIPVYRIVRRLEAGWDPKRAVFQPTKKTP